MEVLERRLWCGILDLCTAPRPLQGGSYWVSFMFSEFLKLVFEKHNSCYCFFIDFLCFPSPRPMALRLETTRYGPPRSDERPRPAPGSIALPIARRGEAMVVAQ